MSEVNWGLYRYWLGLQASSDDTTESVISSITENLDSNAAYQTDATRNGKSQPLIASRTSMQKCNITVIPGDKMYIGDLIGVFDENWLVTDLYTDEYGVTYGEIWLCNHVFKFQNGTSDIICKYTIIDDGSYSSSSNNQISTVDDHFTCYMSLDSESRGLYVDKRLGLNIILDNKGDQILESVKITWLDPKTGNYGKGSHILKFRIDNDVYNPLTDNIEELICDYIAPDETADEDDSGDSGDEPVETIGSITIAGRSTIRIGTSRTYTASFVTTEGEDVEEIPEDIVWSCDDLPSGCDISYENENCTITIPLDDDIVGEVFTLTCAVESGEYDAGTFEVEVIVNG